MLTLYVRAGCPFCHRVLETGRELGISFDEKDIADDAVATELVLRGGKRQVPYLVDTGGVGTPSSVPMREMYESEDIVAYLREQYSKH